MVKWTIAAIGADFLLKLQATTPTRLFDTYLACRAEEREDVNLFVAARGCCKGSA
jgi:hypothetical protein